MSTICYNFASLRESKKVRHRKVRVKIMSDNLDDRGKETCHNLLNTVYRSITSPLRFVTDMTIRFNYLSENLKKKYLKVWTGVSAVATVGVTYMCWRAGHYDQIVTQLLALVITGEIYLLRGKEIDSKGLTSMLDKFQSITKIGIHPSSKELSFDELDLDYEMDLVEEKMRANEVRQMTGEKRGATEVRQMTGVAGDNGLTPKVKTDNFGEIEDINNMGMIQDEQLQFDDEDFEFDDDDFEDDDFVEDTPQDTEDTPSTPEDTPVPSDPFPIPKIAPVNKNLGSTLSEIGNMNSQLGKKRKTEKQRTNIVTDYEED